MNILTVYIANSNLKINHTFSYLSEVEVSLFTRVKINFNGRLTYGFVEAVEKTELSKDEIEAKLGFQLRFIDSIIDQEAIVNEEIYYLAKWLSKVSISPFISCLNTMLPSILKTGQPKKVVQEYFVQKNPYNNQKLSVKQLAVYQELQDGITYQEYIKKYKSVAKKLIDLNLARKVSQNKRFQIETLYQQEEFKTLTDAQYQAYQQFNQTDKKISLLFGLTGSGKTEVYLHLAKDCIENNKQVLILVPEIGLTPQMIKRVSKRFNRVCIYHSRLNQQERFYQYNRVKNNEVDIVVGTRSAIFLPFNRLGLIIMDEEHDYSYIQENVPCYDCRTIAIKRSLFFNCKVLLASATPSLKVFARALNGDYELIRLNKRINDVPIQITLVDNLKDQSKQQIIGSYLEHRITEELAKQNQIILLLNKRGYISYSSCESCLKTMTCRHCDIALAYHKDENCFKCHHCARIYPRNLRCDCGSRLSITSGYGTKKVEELCRNLFPNASVARYDYDSTRTKDGHAQILNSFEHEKIDILIGTQMIAKGLDFPKVSLVGIIDGDAGLRRDSYRANEECFQLLMQASGRGGRHEGVGEVVIQTSNPEHTIFKAIESQDYEQFYQQEIEHRAKLKQPPFINIVSIELKDKQENRLNHSKQLLVKLIQKQSLNYLNPLQLAKLNDLYRVRILVIHHSIKELIDQTTNVIDSYLEMKNISSVIVHVDPVRL